MSETRPVYLPTACFCHDEKEYLINFELPGVDKDHIEVHVSEQSLCVTGSRDDAELAGCYTLAHEVDADKAEAKYENGLLRLRLPLKEPAEGKKIEIQ
ncbi:MAG: Hsp20/alpha crystallin family protein [Candidatus Bathyarchaeota archaeon]|nr:Hsp20/alpha crystallin family protein [Candidatus Bathyarchaeota archaeon]